MIKILCTFSGYSVGAVYLLVQEIAIQKGEHNFGCNNTRTKGAKTYYELISLSFSSRVKKNFGQVLLLTVRTILLKGSYPCCTYMLCMLYMLVQ